MRHYKVKSNIILRFNCTRFSKHVVPVCLILTAVGREISYQLALKRFPSLGPPANGNESNAKKSRFRPNRNNISLICNSEKI